MQCHSARRINELSSITRQNAHLEGSCGTQEPSQASDPSGHARWPTASHYLWFQQKHQKQTDFSRSTSGSHETEQGMEGHHGAMTKDLLPSVITLCPCECSRDTPSSRLYLLLSWIKGSWELHLGHRTCQLSAPLLSYISRPLSSFIKILDLG